MRKSSLYLMFIGLNVGCLIYLLFFFPLSSAPYFEAQSKAQSQLVRELGITDLCLFTEARYTRHLSQADLFSAFQDHPSALEHFPAGSNVLPPTDLWSSRP